MILQELGLIHYAKAYELQKKAVEDILAGKSEEMVFICSHYPIVTLGKKSTQNDLLDWSGETMVIERGGRATYHGPQQIIIYPILDLKKRDHNLGGHLRNLERMTIDLLKNFGLEARGNPNYAGVWVEEKKVASIGIAVKKWVTYHGIAINLAPDELAFTGISACGSDASIMTNLQDISGKEINYQQISNMLQKLVIEYFSLSNESSHYS